MSGIQAVIPSRLVPWVETLWSYHDLRHEIAPTDIGIGLGSHDIGVALVATELYHKGMFPLLVFSGSNSPTTIDTFPQGEAVHYREHAISNGVPKEAILTESRATNTGENIVLVRQLLAENRIEVKSVTLMTRPYQQRRAYATCRMLWPQVQVLCASRRQSLEEYVATIGDPARVINMLVGDTQRIDIYAQRGFAISQEMPEKVQVAFRRLVEEGYTERLV